MKRILFSVHNGQGEYLIQVFLRRQVRARPSRDPKQDLKSLSFDVSRLRTSVPAELRILILEGLGEDALPCETKLGIDWNSLRLKRTFSRSWWSSNSLDCPAGLISSQQLLESLVAC